MYVFLSVTGLRLKYTGLRIVYIPFGTHSMAHNAIMIRWRTGRIEDDGRLVCPEI